MKVFGRTLLRLNSSKSITPDTDTVNDSDATTHGPRRASQHQWVCNGCREATFNSQKEAIAHESNCGATSPSTRKAATTHKQSQRCGPPAISLPSRRPLSGGPMRRPMSPYVGGPTRRPQVALARIRSASSKGSVKPPMVVPNREYDPSLTTKLLPQLGDWSCDVCDKSFSTYANAALHEARCRDKQQLRLSLSPSPSITSTSNSALHRKQGGWLCDYCQVAHFPTFDEAVAHEKTCYKRQQKTGPPQTIVCGRGSKAAKLGMQTTVPERH